MTANTGSEQNIEGTLGVNKSKGFGIRHRYFFARSGILRLRFVMAMLFFLSAMATFGPSVIGDKMGSIQFQTADAYHLSEKVEMDVFNTLLSDAAVEPEKKEVTFVQTLEPEDGQNQPEITKVSMIVPAPKPARRIFTVQSGDSLSAILDRASVSAAEAYNIVNAVKAQFDPRDMKVGQKIVVDVEKNEKQHIFKGLYIQKTQLDYVRLAKLESGDFDVKELKRKFKVKTGFAEVKIDQSAPSLYYALRQEDVPIEIIAQMIHSYSWDIDFQRDIHPGNTLKVLYEHATLENGEHVNGKGRLLYASLNTYRGEYPIYFYTKENGRTDYFNDNGESIRKALLSTPVDGARLSSGFGMRKHPVLGYNKMHKGTDFAAPTGTPIYAAGDGVVERADWFSSYGKYVRIRHNGELKTAYAHMNGFGKGIKAGARVTQGQVIGYIGTTGRSTGAHLHYEVLKNGKQVNPNSLKLPKGEKLADADLKSFMATKAEIDRMVRSMQKGNARIALLKK